MLGTEKLSENVIKIVADGNCYLVEGSIIIDTSREQYKEVLKQTVNSFTNVDKIKKVIFTHLHYDHISNFDLFKNAEFFGAKEAVQAMKSENEKLQFILDPEISKKFNINLKDIESDKELLSKFEITKTPGHCVSAILIYYKKDNILFTGDTYFREDIIGRVDLPKSQPELIDESVAKVIKIIQEKKPIIAPGHDY